MCECARNKFLIRPERERCRRTLPSQLILTDRFSSVTSFFSPYLRVHSDILVVLSSYHTSVLAILGLGSFVCRLSHSLFSFAISNEINPIFPLDP